MADCSLTVELIGESLHDVLQLITFAQLKLELVSCCVIRGALVLVKHSSCHRFQNILEFSAAIISPESKKREDGT